MSAPLVVGTVLGLTVALAGCTGSSTAARSAPAPTATGSGTTSPQVVDPAAQKAIDRADRVTRRLRSYAFHARTTVSAAGSARSVVDGRVIRGRGLTYRLTAGGKRTEVVRTRTGTYVRRLPGRWSKLAHPRTVLDPTGTLLIVLRGITPTSVSGDGTTVVRGTLARAAATDAGLPRSSAPANVVTTIDRAGRVVALTVRTTTRAGTQDV